MAPSVTGSGSVKCYEGVRAHEKRRQVDITLIYGRWRVWCVQWNEEIKEAEAR